jgi:hypothetical protein
LENLVQKPETWNGVRVPYDAPIPILGEQLRSHGAEAWAAFIALGANPTPEALQLLVVATQSADPYYRRAAVEAIAGHKLGTTAAAVLCQCLHDASGVVVRAACEATAALNIGAAHAAVLRLIEAPAPATRIAALRALAVLWQPADFAPVFACAQHDASAEVHKEAAWTLYRNVDAAHWATLFAAWRSASVVRHRVWACEIAARFGGSAVLARLEELRTDPDGHVRQAAERVLKARGMV